MKLRGSLHKETVEESNGKSKKPVFKINVGRNTSSCVINVGKIRCRTLDDPGAQVSLISKKMFNNLPFKPKIVCAGPKLLAAKRRIA